MDLRHEFKELMFKYLNDCRCEQDNNYTGWIKGTKNYEKLQESVLDLGISFIIRTSSEKKEDWSQSHARLVYQSQQGVPIPYSGVPFFVQKNIQMQCRLGPKRKIPKGESDSTNQDFIHNYAHHRNHSDSKKMGCPAYMNVKAVKYFYTYALDVDEQSCSAKTIRIKKQQRLKELMADLEIKDPPFTLRFYVEISDVDSHNHGFGVPQQLGSRIHPKIAKKIDDLVQSGVCRPKEVKYQLGQFTSALLKDHHIRPSESNSTYFPSDHVIRTRIYNAKKNMQKVNEQCIETEQQITEETSMKEESQQLVQVSHEQIEQNQLCNQLRELLEQTKSLSYLLQDDEVIKKGINFLQQFRDEMLECMPHHDGTIVVKLVELPIKSYTVNS